MNNADPIAAFDGRTLNYTYNNGWSFTNTFDGHLREDGFKISNAYNGGLS